MIADAGNWDPRRYRAYIIGFGAFALCALLLSTFLRYMAVDAEWVKECEEFIRGSDRVAELVGEIVTLEFRPNNGARVQYRLEETTGRYLFFVAGSRESGYLSVRWVDSNEHGFTITDARFQPEEGDSAWVH